MLNSGDEQTLRYFILLTRACWRFTHGHAGAHIERGDMTYGAATTF